MRLVSIGSSDAARFQLERIGSDQGGVAMMFRKTITLNMKVHSLKTPQAHILKQEMLSIGADAAVAREVLVNGVERSDVLLIGTVKQFHELSKKLLPQPFAMKKLSAQIREILGYLEKKEFLWKVKGRNLHLGRKTLIMGVVNVTPDSFSDGGRYKDRKKAIEHAIAMAGQGADIIDIGGESTRPGAGAVSAAEEKKRVLPVIEAVRKEHSDLLISIDTYKSDVAEAALACGADIVNDISGLHFDPRMKEVAAASEAGVILMHTRGRPSEMQKDTGYDDFMEEVTGYFQESVAGAVSAGIHRESIVIDPGIGFGKSFEHNLFLLRNLGEFRCLGLPLLVGPSRKAFIGRITGKEAPDRDDGTAAAVTASVLHGAHIVRVHNVSRFRDAVLVADSIKNAPFF